ncbi:MAG: ribosome silencing factor [Firmicutes bacterium]|nr:ribosome silencing factor [Bacillota bacterium]
MTKNSAENMAKIAARTADEKKADQVRVLKMPEVMTETEYFVVSSATAHVQVRAIVDSITAALEEAGAELLRYEGRGDNNWVLLDYGNVVIHVFLEEERRYYNIEKLWADAEQVSWYE